MYIKIRAKTNAKKESIVKENDSLFVISVKEKAERNMANKRIIEILKEMYPGKSVRIIHGHHEPSKLVAVGE